MGFKPENYLRGFDAEPPNVYIQVKLMLDIMRSCYQMCFYACVDKYFLRIHARVVFEYLCKIILTSRVQPTV